MRWRYRFTVLTVVVAVALLGWGAFVTSIDAGMAVPDWPASFGSFDPFQTGYHDPADPAAAWWNRVPILAEHGHRLLGALIGLMTLVLAGWTWVKDPRRWMRWLGVFALVLVIAQGVLGGLRVVYASMNLAMVHACVAQIFFSLLVAMTLFTSRGWLRADGLAVSSSTSASSVPLLRALAVATAVVLYGQIILGVLLRHPGTGIDPMLAGIHMTGAFVALGLIAATFAVVRRHFKADRLVRRGANALLGIVVVQMLLGFTAYFTLLDESGMLQPSNVQVIVNSAHLIVGALLMASAVCLAILALRRTARGTAASRGGAASASASRRTGPTLQPSSAR